MYVEHLSMTYYRHTTNQIHLQCCISLVKDHSDCLTAGLQVSESLIELYALLLVLGLQGQVSSLCNDLMGHCPGYAMNQDGTSR